MGRESESKERPSGSGDFGAGQWLAQHRAQVAADLDRSLSAERWWSWGRLILFGLALAIWVPLGEHPVWAGLVSGLILVGFVWAVAGHGRTLARRKTLDRTLLLLDESRQRVGGQVTLVRGHDVPAGWADRPTLDPILDWGRAWALSPQELDDLDVLAPPVGLFGLVNRTSTALGAARLKEMLSRPCLDPGDIQSRQTAVRWVEQHSEARLDVMAGLAVLRGQDEWFGKLIRAVQGAVPLPLSRWSLALRVWSVFSVIASLVLVALIGLGQTRWVSGLSGLAVVNGLIYLSMRRSLNQALGPWRNVVTVSRGTLVAARQGAASLPAETLLARIRQRLSAAVEPGALPALCSRAAWADGGGAIQLIFNVMYFYDLHVAEAILKPAVSHRDTLLAGMSALADLDALTGLACFAFEQPVKCYPHISDEPLIEIKAGCHPLIGPEEVVPNYVRLDQATHLWVITGSNMAGKSTLLRMTGVNVLLAQIGTVACAEEMQWTPVGLISDLQVRDNLSRHESYFLAEVRHLKRLVCGDEDGVRLLGLMDEPFRGTNSTEQVAASLAVVEHLIRDEHFYLVATHEQRITELATGSPAANYHFQEDLGPSGMVFDYRLRTGPAHTRNALRVLEREGYPEDLMRRAREWLARGTTDTSD
ncbi:MAG: hypothetical protein ACE5GE_13765 [Phycisphaerae bacterium]